MIKVLKRADIEGDFLKVVPALSRTFEKTDLASFWWIEDLWNHLINDEVIVFLQEDTGYAGVLQIAFAPRCKILNFFWSGHDPSSKIAPNWDEIDAFLIHAAKQLGCSVIQCEGRRGWKPILTSRGYSEDSVIYTKKVNDELHVLPSVQE